jgi:hypothetical protein
MLKKLMKYELRATSRLLVPLYLIMLFMSLVNRFTFSVNNYEGPIGVFNQFLMIIYVTSIFAVIIATGLYMIIRFYKNLLTDEGYLMFTLPAETHQHIISKLLITLFWSIAGIFTVLFSLFIAFATADTMPTIINGMKEAVESLNRDFGANWVLPLVELIIMMILGLIASILLVYLSIAVGQLFTKHKIIGSFAAYMIIHTALQFAMVIVVAVFGNIAYESFNDFSSVPQVIFPIAIVGLVLGCAGFFFGTNYLFKKKLNLD